MDLESKELTEFVKGVLNAVENGQTNEFTVSSEIEFELAIINTKEASGKLNVFVANAGGKYEKEAISKIKFSMGKKKPFASVLVSKE